MLTLLAAVATGFTGCTHHRVVRPASIVFEVRLSRPVRCVRGRTEFSRWAWTFTGARPAHVARTGTEVLPCAFPRLKP